MQGKKYRFLARLMAMALTAAMMMAASSCSSHKKVVRGDQAYEVSDSKKKDSKKGKKGKKGGLPDTPGTNFEISKEADNKYAKSLMKEAYGWIGTPYVYGGQSKNGADCSGFVMMAYKNALDISLPRRSSDMGDFCEIIDMKGNEIDARKLKVGDLIFFHTGSDDSKITHVGIYAGEGRMIHAGSSKGVTVVDLSGKYYRDHFLRCGRVPAYHKLIKNKKK